MENRQWIQPSCNIAYHEFNTDDPVSTTFAK